MGGGVSQSNTSQTQNTQQASNAAPPPWASAALQQAMQSAQSLARMPFVIQPQPIAALQPQQREAFQTVENLQGAYTPFLEAGLGAIGQGAGMQGPAAQYQTPWGASQYFGAESAGVLPELENIFGQQMAQTTGDLVNRAGGTDAERIAVGQGELANQQGLAAGQTLSQLMGQAVTQGQQAGMNLGQLGMNLGQLGGAAGNLANLGQTMGLQGAQAELNTGTLAQQQLQNMQNAIYANNQQAVSWPFQTNAYLSTIASGLTPPAGGNMTQLGSMQGQSQTKGSSLGGSLGGLAGGLARGGRIAGAEKALRQLLEQDEDDDHKHHGHGRQGVKAIARPLGYAEEPRSELDLIPGSSFAEGGQVIAPSGRLATPMKGGGSSVDPQQQQDILAENRAVNQQLMGVPMELGLPAGYNPDPGWRYDPAHPERLPPAANPFAGAMSPMQLMYPTHVTTPVMPYRNSAWGPPAPWNWQPYWESSVNMDMNSPRFMAEAEQAGLPMPSNWDLGASAMQDQLGPWVAGEHTTTAGPTTAGASNNALAMLMAERQALTAQLGGMPSTPASFAGPSTASSIPGAAMLPAAQQGAAPGRAHGGRIPMQGGGPSAPATPAAPAAPATTFTGAPALTSPWGSGGSYYGIPPPGTVFPGTPISGVTPGTVLPWTLGASYPSLRAPGTVPGAPPSPPPTPSPSVPTMQAIPQTLGAAGSPTGVIPGGMAGGAAVSAPGGSAAGGSSPLNSSFGSLFGPSNSSGFFDPFNQPDPRLAGPIQQAAPTFGVSNLSGMGKGGGWSGGWGGGSPWTANQNPVNQQAFWPPSSASMPTSGNMGGMPWSGSMGKGFGAGGRTPMQGGGNPPQDPSPGMSIADPSKINLLQVANLLGGSSDPTSSDPKQNPFATGTVTAPQGLTGQAGVKPPPFQQMKPMPTGQEKPPGGGGGGGGGKPKMPKPPGQGQGQGQGQGPAQPAPQAQPPADTQTDTGAPTGPTDPATGIPSASNQIVPPVQVPTPQVDTPRNQFAAMTGGGGPFGGGGGGGPFDVADMSSFDGQDMTQVADAGATAEAPPTDFGGGGDFVGFGARGGAFQTGGYATASSTSTPSPFDPTTYWGGEFQQSLRGRQDPVYASAGADDSQLARRGGAIGRSLAIARRGMDDGGDVGGGDYDPGGGSGRDPTPLPLPDIPDMPTQNWQNRFDQQFHDYTTDRKPDAGPTGPGAIALGTREPSAPLAGRPGAFPPVVPPPSPAPAPVPAPQAGTNASFADRFMPMPTAASRAIQLAQQPSGPAGVSRETVPGYGSDPLAGRPEEQAVSDTNARIAQAVGFGQGYGGGRGGNTSWPSGGTHWTPGGPLGYPGSPGIPVTAPMPLPQARPFGAPGVAPPLPTPRPEGAPGEVPSSFAERFAGTGPPLQSLTEATAGKGDRLVPAHPFASELAGARPAPMGTPGSSWPGPGNVPSSGVLPQRGPTLYSAPGPLAANRPTWLPPHGGGIPQDVLPPVVGTSSAASRAVETANRAPALPTPVAPRAPTVGQVFDRHAKEFPDYVAQGVRDHPLMKTYWNTPINMLPAGITDNPALQQYGLDRPFAQEMAAHQAAVQRFQQQQQAQPRYAPQLLPAGQARPPANVPDASEPASAVRNIQVPTVPSNGVIPGGINRIQPYGNQASIAEQIRRNPALVSRMAEMVRGEVGGQGVGHPGLQRKLDIMELETALNRAQVRGISLDQALLSIAQNPAHGYYAKDTYRGAPSAAEVAAFRENVLKPVMAGSDLTGQFLGKPGTGNASQMAFAGQRLQQGVYERGHWASGRPGVGEMFVVERGDAPKVAALPRHPLHDPWANPVSIGGFRRGGYADAGTVDKPITEDAGQDTLLGSSADDTLPKQITTTQEGRPSPKLMPGAEVSVPAAVPGPAPAKPAPAERPPAEPAVKPVEAKPVLTRQPQQPSRPEDRFAPPPGWGMNPVRAWLIDALSGRAGAAYDFMRNRNAAISEAWTTNYQRMKDQADERFLEGEPNDVAETMRGINKDFHSTLKKTPPAPAAGSTAPAPGTAGVAAAAPGAGAAPGQPGGATAATAVPPMTQEQAVEQQISAMRMTPIEQEMFGRAYQHLQIPRAGGAEELTQLMDHRVSRIEHEAQTGLIAANTAQVAVRTAREGWLPLGANGEHGYLNVNPFLTNPHTGQPVPANDPSRYTSPLVFRRMMFDALRGSGSASAPPAIGGALGQPQPPAALLSPTPLTAPAPLQGGAWPATQIGQKSIEADPGVRVQQRRQQQAMAANPTGDPLRDSPRLMVSNPVRTMPSDLMKEPYIGMAGPDDNLKPFIAQRIAAAQRSRDIDRIFDRLHDLSTSKSANAKRQWVDVVNGAINSFGLDPSRRVPEGTTPNTEALDLLFTQLGLKTAGAGEPGHGGTGRILGAFFGANPKANTSPEVLRQAIAFGHEENHRNVRLSDFMTEYRNRTMGFGQVAPGTALFEQLDDPRRSEARAWLASSPTPITNEMLTKLEQAGPEKAQSSVLWHSIVNGGVPEWVLRYATGMEE